MKIRFENVNKSYQDFSLSLNVSLPEHSFVSILGPSGSGKTTTLNLIAGIETPDSGRIFFAEKDVTGLELHKRNLGMVFQDYALFPHMDLGKNIRYGLKVRGKSAEEQKKRSAELISLLRLEGMEKRNVSGLSGGEQQRVALARAIAVNPDILLLDEPLSSLDPELRFDLRKDIRMLQQRYRMTAVYVTHDQLEAFSLSDIIVLMMNGRIVQLSDPETLYNRPVTIEAAAFVGFRNSFEVSAGQPFEKSGDTFVRCLAGGIELEAACNVSSGGKRVCMFRPESCRPAEQAKGPGGFFRGRVNSFEYHGGPWFTEIQTETGIFRVNAPSRPEPGGDFSFFVPAGELLLF